MFNICSVYLFARRSDSVIVEGEVRMGGQALKFVSAGSKQNMSKSTEKKPMKMTRIDESTSSDISYDFGYYLGAFWV